MKKFELKTLNLIFRQATRTINFSENLTYIYGETGLGKSSVARLIDWCLGNDLKAVKALKEELVSCELELSTNRYDVLFERAYGVGGIRVAWRDRTDDSTHALNVPEDTADEPLFNNNVFNVSDLLFYLLEEDPVFVRASKYNDESNLIRLSFRDIFWYCYLRQPELDNDFFRLYREPYVSNKSRDVQRYIFGFHSSRLNQLEQKLDELQQAKRADKRAAEELAKFLESFGYASEAAIEHQINETTKQLEAATTARDDMRRQYKLQTHFADQLRSELRLLSKEIDDQTTGLHDALNKISEQERLRAELISAKLKLGRSKAAQAILSDVEFQSCPSCGNPVKDSASDDEHCRLCHQQQTHSREFSIQEIRLLTEDLSNRTDELQDSIARYTKTAVKQQHSIQVLQERKVLLDAQLNEELKEYDSAFVSNSRMHEQTIATLSERIQNLNDMLRMPQAISNLLERADQADAQIKNLKRQIRDEQQSFKEANNIIADLETTFLDCLLRTGVPDVTKADAVSINRRTWIPRILSGGDETLSWDYDSAGGGGQTTLFKICYALAFHIVAHRYDLPLPSLLIVDSAMKNLAGKRNAKYVQAFYSLLYETASTELRDHQFLIIDSEFIKPPDGVDVDILKIPMERGNPKHRPLVPYYQGE